MDGPGVSIFQGSDSLDIGTNSQGEEEAEALEDEKRRNDELRDLISNAFDDLIDDDDESFANSSQQMNSSGSTDQGDEYRRRSYGRGKHEESKPDRLNSNHGIPRNEVDRKQGNHSTEHINYSSGHDHTDSLFHGGSGDNIVSAHYKHCTKTSPAFVDMLSPSVYQHVQENNKENISLDDEKYLNVELNSIEQLRILYDVRMREIQRLHTEIEMTEKHNKQMEMQLKRRLALMESEKERAVLSLNQAQNLLVTSKGQIEDLEKEIERNKKKIEELEDSNLELLSQLDIAKASITGLQNKVAFLEKNDSSKKKELENDSYVRLIEERHRKEVLCLQEEVQFAKVKLERKEEEFAFLEKKIKDLTRSLENTVADKTEVINRLARSLEESQARCEQLMSSQLSQENMKLSMQLTEERSEKETMQEKMADLQKTVEMLQADIHHYEAVSRLGLNSDSVKDSDSIVHLGINGGGQTFPGKVDPVADVNTKLKEELKKSLIGQRMKREEIKRLQMELEARDSQIQDMQLQESRYLAEAEKFKVNTQHLLQQLKKETVTMVSEQTKIDQLEKELRVVREELKKVHEDSEKHLLEKKRLEKEKSEINSENAKLLNQMEEFKKTKEKEKQESIDRFQKEYLNFHDQALARVRSERNDALEHEIKELRKQLDEAHREADDAKKAYSELITLKDVPINSEGNEMDGINALKQQLLQEKQAFSKFREEHENAMKQNYQEFKNENSKLIMDIEGKSRAFYEKRVAEEIEKAKAEALKELETNYQKQVIELRSEIEKEMLAKQKSMVDAEIERVRKEMEEGSKSFKDSDEKSTELFKECCRLRSELQSKDEYWKRELEKIKNETEKDKLEKLREQQTLIEEKLGNEFREQLKKAEATREHATKMLKDQLEAEQEAFLQKYEEKLHEYSLKIKSNATRSIATSPVQMTIHEIDQKLSDEKANLEKLLEEKEKKMDEVISKRVAEAERKARLEAEELYAGNLDVFRTLMEGKAKEVDEIRSAMASERNRLKAALAEAQTAASEAEARTRRSFEDLLISKDTEVDKLKEQVLILSKRHSSFEEESVKEKEMMRQVMARWASEVQELKEAKKAEDKKLIQVYKKYQEIKKTVAAYKSYMESKDKQLKNEHDNLVETFTLALNTIEERMKEVCAKQDATQVQRIAAIEASFDKKAERLRQKLERPKKDDGKTS